MTARLWPVGAELLAGPVRTVPAWVPGEQY